MSKWGYGCYVFKNKIKKNFPNFTNYGHSIVEECVGRLSALVCSLSENITSYGETRLTTQETFFFFLAILQLHFKAASP